MKYLVFPMKKLSISSEKRSISMENLGFGSKNLLFQIKKFEIPGFLHMELKIWVFDYFENLEFRLAGTEMRIMFRDCFYFFHMLGL